MARITTDIFGRSHPSNVTVFYDGDCPVCRAEIAHYARLAGTESDELQWRDLGRCPDALACFGVDASAARRRLHAIDRNGVLRDGIDAFIVIWRELPGYRWLERLLRLPGLRATAAFFYDHGLVPVLAAWNRRRRTRVA